MAKAINHKERKRQIRAASLRLFARCGFDAVNFGMIAGECGVARTLLYTYFKDKRAIFNEAINEATMGIAEVYREVKKVHASADAKLRHLCVSVFALLYDSKDFLSVIIDFLREKKRSNDHSVENIMRHTLGFKRIVHTLLMEGRHKGEYDMALNVNSATSLVYSQFESAILRITVSGDAEITESVDSLNALLLSFRPRS